MEPAPPPIDLTAFKKEIFAYVDGQKKEIIAYDDVQVEFLKNMIPAEPSEHNSSSSDSAYQLALEFGGGFYSSKVSDRARHRMFRKCKKFNLKFFSRR